MDAEQEKLPKRLFKVPTGEEMKTVDENEFNDAKAMYYGMMGWGEDGRPSGAKLAELDIAWAERYLDVH